MSIENILKRIEEETEEAARGILGKAEAQASLIGEDYAKKGKKLREEIEHRSRVKAADEERRLVVGEELELRKAFLVRKREILDDVYGEARTRLESIPQEAYLDLLRSLIVRHSLSGREEIIVPAAQRNMFTADFIASLNRAKGGGAAFSLAGSPGDFPWGVVLREGQRRVDLTLEVIFEQLKTSIESRIAGILFPE